MREATRVVSSDVKLIEIKDSADIAIVTAIVTAMVIVIVIALVRPPSLD